jgi:hypothetical protein
MDPFRTGKLVLFQVSYDRGWHYFEIPAYMLIGLFGVSPVRFQRYPVNPILGTVWRIRYQVQSTDGGIPA